MSLVLCNDGKLALLAAKRTTLNTYFIHLYQNNHTPSAGDTFADYTVCNFNGYARQATTQWGVPFLNAGGKGETDDVVHTWTALDGSVANQVFGYLVTDAANNLIFAELNPAGPFLVDAGGKSFSVQPRMTETTDTTP